MKRNTIKIDVKRLQEHAKANRWNARQIALAAGLNQSGVYATLRGKTDPAATTLKAICDVIGFPIEDAFTEKKLRKVAA